MPRIARVVMPDTPHHVTQRGNRRQRVFFRESDYSTYLSILREFTKRNGVKIWAYCLMPNHVHIVAVPGDETALTGALGETHRRYTLWVNRREGWTGHLWQGRYASYPMDDAHLLTASRYIEQNPVRAGICDRPEKWIWSSARHHLGLTADPVVAESDALSVMVDDWRDFLRLAPKDSERELLRRHERSGRPLGDKSFINLCEKTLDLNLKPLKRGPRSRSENSNLYR